MTVDLSLPVLVVDDSVTMTRIICTILNQAGFQKVEVAVGGASALEKLRAEKYSIVIADWNMEPMNGYELLKVIRSDESLKDIRFIMVSAEASASHVLAAKEANANGFIVKPFSAQTLMAKIERAFAD
jgi:two-component system, chemotaxis family, chemotaxis protein CheY